MNTTHTTLRLVETDSAVKATEPAADHDLWGRGETPFEAVQHYATLLELANQTPVAADGGAKTVQSSYRTACEHCDRQISMAARYCQHCGEPQGEEGDEE